MPGQGVIVGVGSIDYPAEFQGADETNLNTLGVSKVVTVTSTYDHRIIQGAESGLFLKRVHELLLGEHNFYDDLFRSLEIPYQAVQWASDHSPMNREETMMTSIHFAGKNHDFLASWTPPTTDSLFGISSANSLPVVLPAVPR
jgi:2-oxoglutarate dehydrogenase E1 component